MSATTYRPDEPHQVIELHEFIDHADEPTIEEELRRLFRSAACPS